MIVVQGKERTIDERLAQLRKVKWTDGEPSIEYVPFESPEGVELLNAYWPAHIGATSNRDET